MDRALISKIEKAKRYAEERHRIRFQSFVVTIRGDNRDHVVRYENGRFEVDDEFFRIHGYSAHTMAMERILQGMIESPAPTNSQAPYVSESTRISKIEKAKRYAEERDRIRFESFVVTFHGDNSDHVVRYEDGRFDQDDEFFRVHGYSAHTMAMERILEGMIVSPSHSER
jgi:hypothetical protein